MKIGILDDDDAFAAQAEAALIRAGHSCEVFQNGRRWLNSLKIQTFDLVVLDWNLPDLSGLAVLELMRQNAPNHPPVVFVNSRPADEDIVAGLHAGADDYIVKPVQSAVLSARVSAILRRRYPDALPDKVDIFGEFVFNAQNETVRYAEAEISLTSKQYSLAHLLFRNLNRALSRSYLLEALWGRNPNLQTRTLDAHISQVRSKLRLRPENGYKLAPVYAYWIPTRTNS